MDELARLILLLALTGGALTVLGAAFVWFLDHGRRIRRSLKKMLGGEPHALLIAPGRGKGVAFDFGANAVAVTWDIGGWCLLYRVDELMGAELVVDGRVAARAHRGEPRRALDQLSGAQDHVRLRFVFDDPTYPDFVLDLWSAEDADRKKALTAGEALQEGARWIARMESLLRRPVPKRGVPAAVAAPVAAPVAERPAPPLDDDEDAEAQADSDADEAVT